VILALSASFCGQQSSTNGKPPDDLATAVESTVVRAMKQYQVPGVAVATIAGGAVVWTHGYGMADQEAKVAVDDTTIFQAASISKSVAAWGALSLVEDRALDLDTPIERYLHRWHLPPSPYSRAGVTPRRLLSHTAGLSVGGYPGYPPGTRLPTLEESLSGASGAGEVKLIQAPGTTLLYSGGGYTLLQLAMEEITGQPFATFMRATVLRPLGMTSSAFEWLPEFRSRTAVPYGAGGQRLPNYLFTEQAAAGLYTTVGDLARFVAASLDGGPGLAEGRGVLTPAYLELAQTPAPATFAPEGAYGLGHEIGELTNGTVVVGHSGANRGWLTLWLAIPERRKGLVVLTNSDNGALLVRDVLCDWTQRAGGAPHASCR
jgi:CubicO group peptidase (beta-lactamase class C family)